MEYEPVIGIEVHTELKTRTKMFCDCKNDPDEREPNVNICPVCLAHPGTLPVPNKDAIEKVILVGMALHSEIPSYSQFDRKNYFYPDLPKGYQISQYESPLVTGGYLEFINKEGNIRRIRITRVHLEEDTGRLSHVARNMKHEVGGVESDASGFKLQDVSLVDFNRAGMPLMELVTEPDVKSADEARRFAEELQLLIRYVGASDADMEKGQMRVEANVSIRPKGSKEFGTKVELKNINSFRFVEKAIEFEIARQAKLLDEGGKVIQETRGWDDAKSVTFSQRIKEGATDYRYFPEPDLPPLHIDQPWLQKIRARLPELPESKRPRFRDEYGLDEKTIELFIRDAKLSSFFEKVVSEMEEWVKSKEGNVDRVKAVKLASNYVTGDLQKLLNESGKPISDIPFSTENFGELIAIIYEGKISSAAAKEVLLEMFASGKDPSQIIADKDLLQESSEEALSAIVEKVIVENPGIVETVKGGNLNAIQALVGAAMKASSGKGNPQILRNLIEKSLSS